VTHDCHRLAVGRSKKPSPADSLNRSKHFIPHCCFDHTVAGSLKICKAKFHIKSICLS
jgi:hypothetical protein